MQIPLTPYRHRHKPGDTNGHFFGEQAFVLCRHECKFGVIRLPLRPMPDWRA